ncbi:L,D-transpeptidase/peptidoglycan binding protein [Clostridium sp. C8-1-8]|uniref:L,D-transpeptidase family protein n=1 Tax=Clostridium sp. C8-1-8 TaxID=2698831 RepID=UPI001FAD7ADC|nr:L,D-transpeptidase/peptidoglycan binding protein [Clostridium sp. C8-1-8]
MIGSISSVSALLVIYLGMTAYFTNHFYFGTEINSVSVSGKTVSEVEKEMPAKVEAYKLELDGIDGKKEQITASDIGLKYNSNGQVKSLKDKENPFGWITAVFKSKDYNVTAGVSFDKELLKKKLDSISFFDGSKVIEPKNASFKYENGSYSIVNEVYGNKINKDVFVNKVSDAILKGQEKINLKDEDCYVKPQYTSTSQQVTEAKKALDKYVASKITYTFGKNTEVLDGSTISTWLKVDDKLQVTLDETKVKQYLNKLSSTYGTVGKTRDFTTTLGNKIKISGGDYGWAINSAKESQSLIDDIKNGKVETKEPIYAQKGASLDGNDIGNTFVEVDMSKQHLWYYKNGSLVVEGDVVTGNITANHSTRVGVYRVKYKERNTSLKGEDYNVPVSYWMPFDQGIGLHDATWRTTFGGQYYKTTGSHGCVNMPLALAKTIYENMDVGTPVLCYY